MPILVGHNHLTVTALVDRRVKLKYAKASALVSIRLLPTLTVATVAYLVPSQGITSLQLRAL
jgi:hypothetical protein